VGGWRARTKEGRCRPAKKKSGGGGVFTLQEKRHVGVRGTQSGCVPIWLKVPLVAWKGLVLYPAEWPGAKKAP